MYVRQTTSSRESGTETRVLGARGREGTILLASYLGLLTPAFVTCSTNAGKGLVKLITCNDIPGRVEEWHIPGRTMSALPITNTDCRTTEHLTSDSLGDDSWVQKAALQLCRRNVPLLHTSRYVIARDQFYQASLC